MTHRKWTTLALITSLSFFGGSIPVNADAQSRDLDPDAVAAATRYALPLAFDAYLRACAAEMSPEGYVAKNLGRLTTKFQEGSDEAWPGAKSLLISRASAEGDGAAEIFESMPDEALKPFVDGIIEGMIEQEIKSESCSDIERGLELVEPLPADNIAALVGFIMEMDNRERAKRRDERAKDGGDQ